MELENHLGDGVGMEVMQMGSLLPPSEPPPLSLYRVCGVYYRFGAVTSVELAQQREAQK